MNKRIYQIVSQKYLLKMLRIRICYSLNSIINQTIRNSQHYNTIVEDENEEGFYEESNKETN